jgi:predicted RecA/RadA family phage recombinase
MTLSGRITFAAVAALASQTLAAHHSFAMYDQSVKYVFTGVVERINPDGAHLQIVFVPLNDARDALVRDAGGKTASWLVEMGGSAASAREGISVDGMPRGTVFSVGLVPLRNGQRGGARVDGLFTCPKGKAPAAGMHCDSVEGAASHGGGALVKPTASWKP